MTAATSNTQEQWLLRSIQLWALDSNRGHKGHQEVHAAEAVQEHILTEAPADNSEPLAPAPTLPSKAKLKKTPKVVPTERTAAGKGTPSRSKKQAKGKKKESDKPEESDNDDADGETEAQDPAQILETQQKRMRAPGSHFNASPDDSGKDQPKKKAKTAATASEELKQSSRCGAQSFRGTVCLRKWGKYGGKKPGFQVG